MLLTATSSPHTPRTTHHALNGHGAKEPASFLTDEAHAVGAAAVGVGGAGGARARGDDVIWGAARYGPCG